MARKLQAKNPVSGEWQDVTPSKFAQANEWGIPTREVTDHPSSPFGSGESDMRVSIRMHDIEFMRDQLGIESIQAHMISHLSASDLDRTLRDILGVSDPSKTAGPTESVAVVNSLLSAAGIRIGKGRRSADDTAFVGRVRAAVKDLPKESIESILKDPQGELVKDLVSKI